MKNNQSLQVWKIILIDSKNLPDFCGHNFLKIEMFLFEFME